MSLLTVTNLEKTYASPEGSQSRIINVPHFEIERRKTACTQRKQRYWKNDLFEPNRWHSASGQRTHCCRWRGDDRPLRI